MVLLAPFFFRKTKVCLYGCSVFSQIHAGSPARSKTLPWRIAVIGEPLADSYSRQNGFRIVLIPLSNTPAVRKTHAAGFSFVKQGSLRMGGILSVPFG